MLVLGCADVTVPDSPLPPVAEDGGVADYPIKPLRGLWVNHSGIGAPPGSMSAVTNAVFRRPGIVEPIHGTTDVGGESPVNHTDEPYAVFDAGGGQLIYIEDDGSGGYVTYWYNMSGGGTRTQVLNASAASDQYEVGREHLMQYGDTRWYLTTTAGVAALDSQSDSTSRKAGLPPPLYAALTLSSSNARAVADTKFVGYRAVFRRDHADGTFTVGPPSSPSFIENDSGGTRNISINVAWTASAEVVAGDKIEIYRTGAAASEDAVGDYMRLCGSIVLDASDISSGVASYVDRATDAELGSELYTNAGQKGTAKGHYPPPYLRDLTWFKGAAWGIAARERHSYSVQIPASWGALTTDPDRTYGIGRRAITGDTHTTTTIDNISASDMLGIVVGQAISGTDILTNTTVATIASASSITISQAATGTTVGAALNVDDLIELDGDSTTIHLPIELFKDIYNNGTDVIPQISNPFSGSSAATSYMLSGAEITFSRAYAENTGNAFTIRATNGANYSPALPEIGATADSSDAAERYSRLAYSEPDQPEHWPLTNRLELGNGEYVRLVPSGDAMYVFDGGERKIYAVTGTGGDDWRIDLVAENALLVSPHAALSFKGTVYFWGDDGLNMLRGGQIVNLSRERLSGWFKDEFDNLVSSWGDGYNWTRAGWMAFDAFNGELWLATRLGGFGLLYNVNTDEFTFYDCPDASAAIRLPVYSADEIKMYYSYLVTGTTYRPRSFDAWTATTREPVSIIFNRLDLGEPNVVKRWREVVWLFGPSQATDLASVTFSTWGDQQTGTGTVTQSSLAVDQQALLSTERVMPIGRNAAMSAQQTILLTISDTVYWNLEGMVVRVEPLAQRTGARQ